MFTLYGNEASVHSLLQNLYEDKKIVFKDVLYRFYILNDVLYIDIIRNRTSKPEKTLTVEYNIKPDYGLYVEDRSTIHIIVSTRKYELKHIVFDGTTFKSETIYYYHNTIGIPSNPIIIACKSYIIVTVTFILMGKKKAWRLVSFNKSKKDWVQKTIDKGEGLCYTQHDLCKTGGIIHLVYKHYDSDKRLNLKHSFYSCNKAVWHKPQIIYDNGKDKYLPKVFVNELGRLIFVWLELEDEVFLCVANSVFETDYGKLRITNFADSVLLYDTNQHIYAVSSKKRRLFYDLCCNVKVCDDAKELIKRSNFEMDKRIKLLLDIKKEYDDSINNMRRDMSKAMLNNSDEMKTLKEENKRLLKEMQDRDSKIVELEDLNEGLIKQADQLEAEYEFIKKEEYKREQLQKELDDKNSRIVELESLNLDLVKQADSLKEEHEEQLQIELDDKNSRIVELESLNLDLVKQADSLKEEHEEQLKKSEEDARPPLQDDDHTIIESQTEIDYSTDTQIKDAYREDIEDEDNTDEDTTDEDTTDEDTAIVADNVISIKIKADVKETSDLEAEEEIEKDVPCSNEQEAAEDKDDTKFSLNGIKTKFLDGTKKLSAKLFKKSK